MTVVLQGKPVYVRAIVKREARGGARHDRAAQYGRHVRPGRCLIISL